MGPADVWNRRPQNLGAYSMADLSAQMAADTAAKQALQQHQILAHQEQWMHPDSATFNPEMLIPAVSNPDTVYGQSLENQQRIVKGQERLVQNPPGLPQGTYKYLPDNNTFLRVNPSLDQCTPPVKQSNGPKPAGEFDDPIREPATIGMPNDIISNRHRVAKSLGGSYDPQSGGITLPMNAVTAGILEKMVPGVSNRIGEIYQPHPSAPAQVSMQPVGGGGHALPRTDPRVAAALKMKDRLMQAKLKPDQAGAIMGNAMTPEQIEAELLNQDAIINSLMGGGAKKAPNAKPIEVQNQTYPPTQTTIPGNSGYAPAEQAKINAYKAKYGVSDSIAQKALHLIKR